MKIKVLILKIVYIILLISIMYNVIFTINTMISKNEYLSLFGASIIKQEEDSMEPEIPKNRFIITKEVEEGTIEKGDVIAYYVNSSIKVSRVFNIVNDNGKIYYVTKSDANFMENIEKINFNKIIGKQIKKLNGLLSFLITIFQSKITTVFIIMFLILKIFYNKYMYKTKNYRRRKK